MKRRRTAAATPAPPSQLVGAVSRGGVTGQCHGAVSGGREHGTPGGRARPGGNMGCMLLRGAMSGLEASTAVWEPARAAALRAGGRGTLPPPLPWAQRRRGVCGGAWRGGRCARRSSGGAWRGGDARGTERGRRGERERERDGTGARRMRSRSVMRADGSSGRTSTPAGSSSSSLAAITTRRCSAAASIRPRAPVLAPSSAAAAQMLASPRRPRQCGARR